VTTTAHIVSLKEAEIVSIPKEAPSPALRAAREHDDVMRSDDLLNLNAETGCFQKFTTIPLVKNMMMKATILKVAQRPLMEIILGTRSRIES
jgi:hypothetical protein